MPPSSLPFPLKKWLVRIGLAALGVVAVIIVVQRMDDLRGRQPPAAAEANIRDVLTAQQEAWNRGDLDGFMAGYWESEDLRFASGDTVTTGYNATKGRYVKRYKADGKEMGKLTFSDVTVEVLTPDVALVRGRWHLKFEKTAEEPHGLYTLTVKNFGGLWRITSDHTSAAEKK
jgi:ketosteroid isomerase-like protein